MWSSPKHIIVAAELLGALADARTHLTGGGTLWLHGDAQDGGDLPRIDHAIEQLSGEKLAAADRPALTIEDRALYIYTSGTTGLPKAANMNHYRMMLACFAFAGVMNTRASDRMYDCLPMYHTAGGLVATGALLVNGGSVVIREKFSAREFWDDVVRWDCTLFQYIGELCRYLINSPPHPNERAHRLRLACGNGLRPDVWPRFQAPFRNPARSSSSTAPPKATCRCSISRARKARSGAFPGSSPTASRPRSCASTSSASSRCAAPTAFASNATTTSRARSIGRILKDPAKPGARFEGYATRG